MRAVDWDIVEGEVCNAVDFDDLIRLPLQVLESDSEARMHWQLKIKYLLVDECQDTNGAQYRMIKALAGSSGQFTCVGDDDQSIYAWRGAQPENLDELASDYPALKVIKLEQNYRSTKNIVEAANSIIDKNKTKQLSERQVEKLRDLEPDALPLHEDEEDQLDLIPEEDEFESPKYTKPVPGEGP